MKKIFATITLMSVLMVSGVFANTKTGLLLSDLAGEPTPCTETKSDDNTDYGIIVTGLTGIIVTGFTGIIVTGVSDTPAETPVDCGIIVTG